MVRGGQAGAGEAAPARRQAAQVSRALPRPAPPLPGPRDDPPDCPLVLVEGEFDALLLGQELKEQAAVVTLGSASSRLDRFIAELILASPAWYLATDHDAAGNQAAAGWPARARRVVPPEPHKDWTEAHQNGIDLKGFWLGQLGIATTSVPAKGSDDDLRQERAAIMEYDGGLTREAAERGGVEVRQITPRKSRSGDMTFPHLSKVGKGHGRRDGFFHGERCRGRVSACSPHEPYAFTRGPGSTRTHSAAAPPRSPDRSSPR